MRTLRPIDRFQILTTIAYVLLGAVILLRAAAAQAWFGCVFGAVMLAFGVYRAQAIVRARREIGR
jgi:uncharacterized membrane protein HdeD (DUF308 family)